MDMYDFVHDLNLVEEFSISSPFFTVLLLEEEDTKAQGKPAGKVQKMPPHDPKCLKRVISSSIEPLAILSIRLGKLCG